jgi:diaminohydroxyphosphoribosylaminopyrimidine deaminase/5-amino-6-(5-phosphoribosylamino)uracil reductase
VAAACLQALQAADAHIGATAPNPPVGCVLLDPQGEVLAVGAHARAGGPHAEAAALDLWRRSAGTRPLHTAVVTLEPCSHTGRTPPCAQALVDAGVRAVWIGALDPHPRAPGEGVRRLRDAGIDVRQIADLDHPAASGLHAACEDLIAPFAALSQTGRPWVLIKTALRPDGGMRPPPGQVTFTSEASLTHAHDLRRRSDALLTGSGCVLADNPRFTVRRTPDHAEASRRVVVMDRRGRVPAAWFTQACGRGLRPRREVDLAQALDPLGAEGVLSVLVEAGPTLRSALLDLELWDEEIVFRQGRADGIPDTVETRRRRTGATPGGCAVRPLFDQFEGLRMSV